MCSRKINWNIVGIHPLIGTHGNGKNAKKFTVILFPYHVHSGKTFFLKVLFVLPHAWVIQKNEIGNVPNPGFSHGRGQHGPDRKSQ